MDYLVKERCEITQWLVDEHAVWSVKNCVFWGLGGTADKTGFDPAN
jgi:hypothetical protein